MRKIFTLILCLCAGLCVSAQKNSSERLTYSLYYLPDRLIYDEIKTFSYTIIFDGGRNPFSPNEIRKKAMNFESFKEAEKGDMEIRYRFGPFSFRDRKIVATKQTREVNGKKEEYKIYHYDYVASYPMTVSAINTKNGYVMLTSEQGTNSGEPNVLFSTTTFRSQTELLDYWERSQNKLINEFLAKSVNEYITFVNERLKIRFDFFKMTEHRWFFTLKKVDIADEFNANVKKIMNVVENITANEPTDIAKNKLAPQIAYLESLQDKYKATDKKEDVLFFSVNYNLASLYYCLDDMDKAEYYIKRLDEVKEDRSYRNDLARHIATAKERMAKHMLNTRHLDYNPVTDFRLADQKYKSDAIGSAEFEARGMLDGTTTATDYIVLYDSTQIKGKVAYSGNDGEYVFHSETEPEKPIKLNQAQHREFTSENKMYIAAKYSDERNVHALQFALVHYKSDKIVLLEKITGKYFPRGEFMLLKVNDDDEKPMVVPVTGLKKAISDYLKDCDAVAQKAKAGEYGNFLSVSLDKLKKLCQDYTECK
jgi:hypothetical protein